MHTGTLADVQSTGTFFLPIQALGGTHVTRDQEKQHTMCRHLPYKLETNLKIFFLKIRVSYF